MNGESGACEGAWFSFCPYPKVSGNPKVSRGALTGFGRRLRGNIFGCFFGQCLVLQQQYVGIVGVDSRRHRQGVLLLEGASLQDVERQSSELHCDTPMRSLGSGRPEHDAKITLNIIVTGQSSLCGFMAGM